MHKSTKVKNLQDKTKKIAEANRIVFVKLIKYKTNNNNKDF